MRQWHLETLVLLTLFKLSYCCAFLNCGSVYGICSFITTADTPNVTNNDANPFHMGAKML